ncbi:uncharacterized protein LOC106643773 [Copidosoma floridanum]|uniref:uncharacterized protein LOC106643773 n=1 Tax=Copidosoma floridanum TaxID=29053 RepID=UPI0006C974C8|nr:uncharacterized protein LOC106643773 [Copidosoma floridanum]
MDIPVREFDDETKKKLAEAPTNKVRCDIIRDFYRRVQNEQKCFLLGVYTRWYVTQLLRAYKAPVREMDLPTLTWSNHAPTDLSGPPRRRYNVGTSLKLVYMKKFRKL